MVAVKLGGREKARESEEGLSIKFFGWGEGRGGEGRGCDA